MNAYGYVQNSEPPMLESKSTSNVQISKRPSLAMASIGQPGNASTLAVPKVWLGAKSSGGLALPDAHPTPSQMYAPRGVWLDSERLIVIDSGNHRILIWHGIPTSDGQAADVVLGQPDMYSEGPACGRQDYPNGLHLPTGVLVAEEKLLVADAWHHRVLIWNRVPTESNVPPDYAIGQEDLDQVRPNRGGKPSRRTLYWPYGIAYIDGRLYVADTGNRRVLGWKGIPATNEDAFLVLGQPDAESNDENRGGAISASSFRWPHAITGDAQRLWIADAGNHRVLGWNHHPCKDVPAEIVLGQASMADANEWPYDVQGERRLRFPYGIASQGNVLAVADTANNRVLFWKLPLECTEFAPACDVIGQVDFAKFGENHWKSVDYDSLCWPYGVSLWQGMLAVADSGNNRVMLWDCQDIVSDK